MSTTPDSCFEYLVQWSILFDLVCFSLVPLCLNLSWEEACPRFYWQEACPRFSWHDTESVPFVYGLNQWCCDVGTYFFNTIYLSKYKNRNKYFRTFMATVLQQLTTIVSVRNKFGNSSLTTESMKNIDLSYPTIK